MQLAVLQYCCNNVVCCKNPQCTILPPNGRILSDLWPLWPASSHMQRILPYAVYVAPVQPNAAHRQPNAPPQMPHISPYATLWPTKQHHMQRFLQYAAYAAPLQPNAAHRQPNPPPRRQISAPWQPCGRPASSHADTEQHPKCSNASMQLWKEDYGGRRQGR